eukprot:g32552.t1
MLFVYLVHRTDSASFNPVPVTGDCKTPPPPPPPARLPARRLRKPAPPPARLPVQRLRKLAPAAARLPVQRLRKYVTRYHSTGITPVQIRTTPANRQQYARALSPANRH